MTLDAADHQPEETTPAGDTAANEPEVQDYLDRQRSADPAEDPEDTPEEPSGDKEEEAGRDTDTPAEAPDAQDDDQYSERVQKRISKLVAKQREAERDAQYWREQAQKKAETPRLEDKSPQENAPQESDYDTYEEYIEARATFAATERVKKEIREHEQLRIAREKQARVEEKLKKGEGKYPDFAELVFKPYEKGGPKVTTAMFDACNDSSITDDLAYFLAKNVEESERIAALSPIGQARAIGRIEADIEAGRIRLKQPTTTKAPPPIPDRIGGKQGAGGDVDPDKLPIAEWMKRHKAGTLKYK